MLALARKIQESIIIGDDIEVTVLSISKDQVKLGISAPKSIPVHRKEVFLQIQQENKEAANADKNVLDQLKGFKKNK